MSKEKKVGITLSVDELLKIVDGKYITKGCNSFVGISTDTRIDLTGQLFVALVGDSFDAHDFIDQAIDKKSAVILVHKNIDKKLYQESQATIIKVSDTLIALQKLAENWRLRNSAKILAITGSNGKTTTKSFTQAILEQSGSTLSNKKSFNNHWGVPMTLLEIEEHHQWAIIEMGMNHPGEIKTLVEIAHPDVAVVTMVGASHLEGLGSVEGVSEEKESIYSDASRNSREENLIKVFNLDNKYTKEMYIRAKNNKSSGGLITFSEQNSEADVCFKLKESGKKGDFLSLSIQGKIRAVAGETSVPIFGRHNLGNLMAASALALSVGIEPEKIWEALPLCQSEWGRGQVLQTRNTKTQVLFDAYNANPESMAALLGNIKRVEGGSLGRKIAVLGEMKELGAETEKYHRSLGKELSGLDLDLIWFIGESGVFIEEELKACGFNKKLYISNTYKEELALQIESMLEVEDIVFIKGSRGMHLERVADAWGCFS